MESDLAPIRGISSCGRLGQAIRAARRARGMTQAELAKSARVSRSQISAIESSLANPGMAIVMRLLRSLDCTLSLEPLNPERFRLSKHVAQNRPPRAP